MVHGAVTTDVRTFKTTTQELMALSDWLSAAGCTHAAMEATGVYWKPVWHILSDGELQLVLANAAHVKNVPGRKTDVNDATWLADLMAHGLIRASFVPDEPTQQMRDLLRTRKQFVRERSSHTQRLQKTLEDANIKLDSVLTNILGLSSRRILEALIAGHTAPQALAKLAHNNIKATATELEAALHGRVTAHHRFMLRLHLDHLQADRCGHRPHRSGGGRQRRTLSCRNRHAEHHPWHQQPLGRGDRGRDRHRHEPLPQRSPPDLLGRTLSQKRRKRRKAPL
jgi:transposase